METMKRVRLTETDGYLENPHRGCCTFQHFSNDPLYPGVNWSESGPTEISPPCDIATQRPRGYLPSTVAYCRWFWRVLEPEDGVYDFTVIENALQSCQNHGQTLAVRLMPFGSSPGELALPQWYMENYPVENTSQKGRNDLIVPLYDTKEYLAKIEALICTFAERYDNHPSLECIDVAYIGPWGEGGGVCSPEQCNRFAQVWRNAFKNNPCIGLVGGNQMVENVKFDFGWRCDCFGDQRPRATSHISVKNSWNHMYDYYPQELAKCKAQNAWLKAPVHLETCWVPMVWHSFDEYDLEFTLGQGLKYHASYFMPKHTELPEAWIDRLSDFCKRLGYRFVFRQAMFDPRVEQGGNLNFTAWIENIGVAPIYRDYAFALRLRQGQEEEIIVLDSDEGNVKSWLPGDVCIEKSIQIPARFHKGAIDLAAGIVDRKSLQARVNFAVQERFGDRWCDLSGFELF